MIYQIKKLPQRIGISLLVFILLVVILTSFRILFFLLFFDQMWSLTTENIINSFIFGFRFDIRLVVIVILPFLLLSWLIKINGKLLKTFEYSLHSS